MAQLVVRDLDDDVKRRLQRRAKQHGRSMESEVRDILSAAVSEPVTPAKGLGSRIASRFRGAGLNGPIEEIRDWDIRVPDFAE